MKAIDEQLEAKLQIDGKLNVASDTILFYSFFERVGRYFFTALTHSILQGHFWPFFYSYN